MSRNEQQGTYRPAPFQQGAVDISEQPVTPAQQQVNTPPAAVAQPRINFPSDMRELFITTKPEQRMAVLIGLAYAIINDTTTKFGQPIGNKFVTVYSTIRSIRECFGDVPVELTLVQDCIDTMIYKGVVRKFDNTQAVTNDGQQFYAVQYGISRAGWNLVKDYGVSVPQWRVAGTEYDANRPTTSPRATTQRNNGIRSNFNQPRVNDTVSI